MTGAPLEAGVNKDCIDIEAGKKFALAMGYESAEHQMVVEYALWRWARGEEQGAVDTWLSGIGNRELTCFYMVVAHAKAEGERALAERRRDEKRAAARMEQELILSRVRPRRRSVGAPA